MLSADMGQGATARGSARGQQEAFLKPFFFCFKEEERADLLWRVLGYFMFKLVEKIWNENFHQ